MVYYGATESNGLDPKILKSIDEKIDDGIFNSENFRGACHGNASYGYNTYDSAIDNGKKCNEFLLVL